LVVAILGSSTYRKFRFNARSALCNRCAHDRWRAVV
jgi:hypothetical protein